MKGRHLVLFALLLAFAANPGPAVRAASPCYIDPTLFAATVPSQMYLGQGYHVQVMVVDNSSGPVTGLVAISYPQLYLFSDQPSQLFNLQPGDGKVVVFNLVASNTHTGQFNVTASIYLSVGGVPTAVTGVTATVQSIQREPFVDNIPFYVAALVVAVGAVYVVFLVNGRPKRTSGRGEPPTTPGQARVLASLAASQSASTDSKTDTASRAKYHGGSLNTLMIGTPTPKSSI